MSALTDVELERAEIPARRLWREYARSRSALASRARRCRASKTAPQAPLALGVGVPKGQPAQ